MTESDLRDRICVARALAIFAMVYVHVPGVELLNAAGGLPAAGTGFLREGVGRAAAALLAAISGGLCARLLLSNASSPRRLIRRRVRTVLLPMVFWAGLTVLVYALASFQHETFLHASPTAFWPALQAFVNTVTFVGAAHADVPTLHLSFLRDLFVCTVLTWPLLRALRASTALTLGLLTLLYLSRVEIYLVLRPLVLLSFAVGAALVLHRVRLDTWDAQWPVTLAAATLITAAILLTRLGVAPDALPPWRETLLESAFYPIARLCWTVCVWQLAGACVATPLAAAVRTRLPWVFVTFCSHFLLLTLTWFAFVVPLLVRMPDGARTLALFGWFLCAPVLSFAFAGAVVALARSAGPAAAMLAGAGQRPVARAAQASVARTLPSGPASASSRSPGETGSAPVQVPQNTTVSAAAPSLAKAGCDSNQATIANG